MASLTKTQKNFRKEMEQLKKDGYDADDHIYSTIRKRKKLKNVGYGSAILLFLFLLYPLSGLFQTAYNGLTVSQHSKIVSYLEMTNQFDEPFYKALNQALPTPDTIYTSSSYQAKLLELQTDLNDKIIQLTEIKPPKKFEEYDELFKQRSQEIVIFIYLLRLNSQINNVDEIQLQATINKINEMQIRERLALAKALDESGLKYTIDAQYNIRYEYLTY
ncbi:hypothetical protein DS745_07380 [Anaerobacillus alkaliphilus]|uniref:Uncharacterized protein n=1 Tax=Anaerobacillus alkaliphilus TaxID=1548597 RepID=A0A4Q0VUU3_9BACI|nr:hypothetical protein [Anaerobacillus alkaliphilus]RXJ02203.1 hypothetical protein DS745_07380 [Anaerobacillus alkaliphilus]